MKRITSGLLMAVALLFLVRAAHATVWSMTAGPGNGPDSAYGSFQGMINNGGETMTGSLVISPIGTELAPVLSTNGTPGVTSYVYACTPFDFNVSTTGTGTGADIPSATATIATGNATLTAVNSINVTCPGKKGALGFLIHKVDTSHIIGVCYTSSGHSCTFVDTGAFTSFTYTPNTTDQTGSIGSGLVTTGTAYSENTLGTQLTTGTAQAQTAFTATGATTAMGCVCSLGVAPPATWQTGIILGCAVTANTLTPWEFNPTAGSITPAAVLIDCRLLP